MMMMIRIIIIIRRRRRIANYIISIQIFFTDDL